MLYLLSYQIIFGMGYKDVKCVFLSLIYIIRKAIRDKINFLNLKSACHQVIATVKNGHMSHHESLPLEM